MYSALLTVAWLISLVYATIPAFWLVIHPFAERWRARRRSPYYIVLPNWGICIAIAGLITQPWRHVLIYNARWTWIPAIIFFGIGFSLYRSARRGFTSAQLAGRPELESGREQKLAVTGIRARLRHPVYAGHLCELLGWSIGTGLAVIYALTAFAIVTGALMIRLEENELERRFGDAYREYKRSAPAIIPSLRAAAPPRSLH
jgi:protein-S-isoprenylcysteine O-methyltransferase Ste14